MSNSFVWIREPFVGDRFEGLLTENVLLWIVSPEEL